MEKLEVSSREAEENLTLCARSSLATLPFSVELAQELLTTYGSPLYVYQGDYLRQTIQHISQAIPYPRTQFRFASVTNGNIALLQIFRELGWGLHANTPGDIYLGLQAGFAADRIVYSGSNLNREEMEQVLHWGIRTLNLDSLAQLQLCCDIYIYMQKLLSSSTLRLGLRLNEPELTGESRIGVRPSELQAAVAIARNAGLKLGGLHFYRGTGTNATKAFTQVIDDVISIAQQLPDWEYLDFGGGFGYPYRHGGAAFDWELFGAELTERLSNLERKIDLVIEPGRAAIAGCATLLAEVVSVKWQGKKQIVGVDTTVANLSVPSVHGGYREIVSWKDNLEGERQKFVTDVCGNTTYSRDYLGKNCLLPALGMGDILAILDVGAYGFAMSSHFLHRPKPAEVLLENGKHRLIRKREDYSVLLANQVFDVRE
ncbi:decarboxylase [Planktothrix sp. FACHB-1355]|uniref:Decarboxylase n=1 Tax=Aerosakkonema funiforme FACHB-1375 TaxID=2949571 RepID=A0A926VIN4_9CYAN|nr:MULTISPECIES: decarboxylase [Oscillatoriales]MBD2184585.1 decarboxylase [Aerosakkonema funiforme FACHB-1375]MBD3560099.1 decarboxylase [Planktothrix sp. FACHB-1355]